MAGGIRRKMKSAARVWLQKTQLYRRQKGLCYYCKRFMRLQKWPPEYGKCPPDLATLEHLDPRGHPDRGRRVGEYRRVLACHQCNAAENRRFQSSLTPEQLAWIQAPRQSRASPPSSAPAQSTPALPDRPAPPRWGPDSVTAPPYTPAEVPRVWSA